MRCVCGATPPTEIFSLSCVAYAQIYYLPLQHRLKSMKRRGSIKVSPMFIVFGDDLLASGDRRFVMNSAEGIIVLAKQDIFLFCAKV